MAKSFITEDFLLNSDSAKALYQYAKDMPIFDYHCHLNPQDIYEDKPFENVVDLWITGDHYKWRLMRANGVDEKYITGDSSKEDKFRVFAETIEVAWGNPVYHWSNLELKQVFGIDKYLTGDNWKEIYDECNRVIEEKQLSPRKLLRAHNVKFVGTTDAPLDTLEWHKKLQEDETMDFLVAPNFRPDEAFVHHVNFKSFIEGLREVTGKEVNDFRSFIDAMEDRIAFFKEMKTSASDISFDGIFYNEATEEELNAIFDKVMAGGTPTAEEAAKWQTEAYVELCGLYKKYDFVTLVHFGASRNNNSKYSSVLGGDTGFDSIDDQVALSANMNALLDRLSREDKLGRMIWFPLNPAYNTVVANNLANYQLNNEGVRGKLQLGAAWWHSDTKPGMLDQMEVYANHGLFDTFVGMLTDSRSYPSYQRHDYFRRILCNMVGDWMENGEVPNDPEVMRPLIENICYNNAEKFFYDFD